MREQKHTPPQNISSEKLAETTPAAIVKLDKTGRFVYLNSKAETELGLDKSEIIEKSYSDIEWNFATFEGEEFPGENLPFEKVKKTGKPVSDVRLTINRPEGQRRYLSINASPLFDHFGDFGGIIAVLDDVTEWVQVKQQLEESKQRYKRYFEELGDAVFITEVGGKDHGRILDANPSAADQTGYTRDELIGMDIENEIAVKAQETTDYKEGDKKLNEGETLTFTEKKRRKDGTEYWTEVLITPLEYVEKEAFLSINRDITERVKVKAQLEQYKMAVEGSDDLIVACDQNYKHLFANSAYKSFYQVEDEELQNYKIEDLMGNENFQTEVKPRLDKCLQGKGVEYDMKHEHPEMGERQLRINYYPLKREGRVTGAVAIMRDITGRKETERKLEEREKKYRQIFNNVNDAMYLYKLTEDGMPGKFLEVNDIACEMLGYSRDELLSMSPWDIGGGRTSRDLSNIMKDLTSNGRKTFEIHHETKEGSEIPVEISSHVFEMDGEKRILSIARDISIRKRTQQALNDEKDKLKNLHDAVDQLQQQNDEESILQTAVDVSESILDFELCALDLIEGDYLVTKARSSGLSVDQTHKYKIGEGIGGLTAERGETIWGDDLKDHPEAKPANEDFRAFISVPIGEVGVFQVVSREVGQFDEQDVGLAEILSNHLREEISRLRLEEELREQALRDPLTKLYNRRYFNEMLGKEVKKCKRYGGPIAFLMADVNGFKEINDSYSHQVGDEILQEVADILTNNVRNADTAVRYGGDEFLVMMPETKDKVDRVVERIETGLEKWNEQSAVLDIPLTLDMGVSHWKPEQDRDVEEALKEADEKMYVEKER